jgi:transmembrane sensor
MKPRWPFALFHRSAAAWFARLKGGPVTVGLDRKYRRWLAADPANEIDYERHELAWELAGELAKDEEIAALVADAHLGASEMASRTERSRGRLLAWSAAAATIAAIAVGAAFYLQQEDRGEQYLTAVGEQRTIVLPDRSRMVLNTSTRVRVIYSSGARRIELEQGEATFSVEHDASRPFEVKAASGTARALGTEFNVLTGTGGATVAVLTGKVEVITQGRDGQKAARSVKLTQGQEVTYTGERVLPVRAANAERIRAWHSGRIVFEDVPLGQAVTEFNRYTSIPLVVRGDSLAELRVTGLFRIGETDALLRALDTAFGVEAERRESTIELHRRDGEAAPPQ